MAIFSSTFLDEAQAILRALDVAPVEAMARGLASSRDRGGRLFILGVGGSAGHAGHAVNDFRKLCGFEAWAPTDNVSELTARINDEGWDNCFAAWLAGSRIRAGDAVLVFSVGGGDRERNVSVNLVRALETARSAGASIYGIVGRDGGFTAKIADACVVVPVVSRDRITPHTEGLCAVLWHLLVSHPALQKNATRWESLEPAGQAEGSGEPRRALRVKLFADGADLASMLRLAADPRIEGFTTNPTLMRKAGIRDYEAFAREALARISGRPVSFEVFSDDLDEMARQARYIASWGENVNVKIPVTNTRGESTTPILRALAEEGVKLNVTALMTLAQVEMVSEALAAAAPSFVSVFAGRIADTGRDPLPIMSAAVDRLKAFPHLELIWASPRELLNVFQADAAGCHVITATPDLLKKLDLVGKDLDEFSLDTVKMFHEDARAAGFSLELPISPSLGALAEATRPAHETADACRRQRPHDKLA
jgi:transaldolase